MSRKFINETNTIAAPRRANDFLIHPKRFPASESQFDEFWREVVTSEARVRIHFDPRRGWDGLDRVVVK